MQETKERRSAQHCLCPLDNQSMTTTHGAAKWAIMPTPALPPQPSQQRLHRRKFQVKCREQVPPVICKRMGPLPRARTGTAGSPAQMCWGLGAINNLAALRPDVQGGGLSCAAYSTLAVGPCDALNPNPTQRSPHPPLAMSENSGLRPKTGNWGRGPSLPTVCEGGGVWGVGGS